MSFPSSKTRPDRLSAILHTGDVDPLFRAGKPNKVDAVSEASADPPPVAIWQHALSVLLFFGFMGLGWLRLNDCDLFNPDSPRYVIYAQSLVEHGSYRAIDTPGEASTRGVRPDYPCCSHRLSG